MNSTIIPTFDKIKGNVYSDNQNAQTVDNSQEDSDEINLSKSMSLSNFFRDGKAIESQIVDSAENSHYLLRSDLQNQLLSA